MIISFIFYFAVMLFIGLYFFFNDKDKSEKSYFLGGRKMGPWVTAMSAQASDMSAWLLMGLPGSIMAFGFGQAWIGIGLVIGTALNWIVVAKRLRVFSGAYGDSITIPQYLTNRFFAKSKVLSVICAIVFLVSFTIYVASGFVAGAAVFTTLIPTLDSGTAMLLFAAIIIIYTFLGGFKAVCWTDMIQGILMISALIAIPIITVATGDLDFSALNRVYTYNGVTYKFVGNLFSASASEIISGLAWGLGYFGMPHILVRFMAIKDPSKMKRSSTVAIIWVVFSLLCAIIIAYLGRLTVADELLPYGNQKLVFITLAKKYTAPAIAGILMAAVLAASMSTADSQLLVASSSFTSDIYKPLVRKNASDKELLWVGRLVVLAISLVAYFIASNHSSAAQAIMNLVENAWGIFGAAFGPVIILSLFWKRFTYKGAVAGIVTGALTDIIWLVFLSGSTGIYEILPGFVAGLIAAVIASHASKEPSELVMKTFDEAVKTV
ncbi:MAG: sodium/proline symporter PutP [Sphaerochaetaceae bacterium]|nr:sodium/proline symporter PutP [Sphaerochaetaceae bacterium]